MSKYAVVRLAIVLMIAHGWSRRLFDIKSAFLSPSLDYDLYVHHARGYVQVVKESHVYLLTKDLYGLKLTEPLCYQMFHNLLSFIGFQRHLSGALLSTKYSTDTIEVILVYVDNVLKTRRRSRKLKESPK